MATWYMEKYPRAFLKVQMGDASTYNKQEIEDMSREVVGIPYTAAYLPKLAKCLSVNGAFPNGWEGMKNDSSN